MIGDQVGVTVWMPGRVYGALVGLAEDRSCRVADLVGEQVEGLVASDRNRDRALSALSRGWDDRSVSEQLGVPVVRVESWRKQLKLRSAKPGMGEGPI